MLEEILSRPSPEWMGGSGPEPDVVISSRIRLARNVSRYPFPHMMTKPMSESFMKDMAAATRALNDNGGYGRFEIVRMGELSELEREVLVEKHLISPQHAQDPAEKGVILRDDEVVSVMVNEEDHLRIQALFSGLQLEHAVVLASGVDDVLESSLDYAYSSQHGYLTACPTNAGTGLRASVMVHLPALAALNQAGNVLSATGKLGVAVRGLYGEGTEAGGNLFQISNQITLGQTEAELINNLHGLAGQITDQERKARSYLLNKAKEQVEDRVWRAYALLSSARVLTSDEALKLWSEVRLGFEMGLLKGVSRKTINEVLIITRPAYLQYVEGREMTPLERDAKRAALVRERFK
ncbi:MAG: protein arginine kinase [Firmicutes bacterium]|nr:protein arginine kinase [Bacillota bacterium]